MFWVLHLHGHLGVLFCFINRAAIEKENITFLHELLHIFVRLHPEIHTKIQIFRHKYGHYKKPKNDSEHFFIYASQYYLTGYAEFYKRLWPQMFFLLKSAWGAQKITGRGFDESWVAWAMTRDKPNFSKL